MAATTRRIRRRPAAEVAARRSAQQQAAARAAAEVAGAAWSRVDLGDIARSWASLLPGPLGAVTVAQRIAASGADAYVAAVAGARTPAGLVVPSRLAGIASDGRPLGSLLYTPAVRSLEAIRAGAAPADALQVGRLHLDMIVRTQVADAGRVADGIAITARRDVGGYIRMLSGKSCSRCVLLAGKFFRWNEGFQRHPRCDCRHVPAGRSTRAARGSDPRLNPRAAFNSMTRAEQDRAFTAAGAQAIRDGSDMGRVVNARRGMSTTGESRTRVNPQGLVVNERHRTRTGTATSSVARGGRRLMPETIYERAGEDREKALRMLRQQGYLIGQPTRAARIPAAARPAPPTFDARHRAAASNERALGATPAGLPRQSGAPTLSRQQRAALRDYESSFYYAINGQLRRDEVGTLVGRRVAHIDQVMALSRTSAEIAAWRGISNAGRLFGDRLGGNLTGFTWTERAYGSTTVDRRIAESFTYPGVDETPKVLMRILVPRGTGAARISGMGSGLSGGPQAEVLLQRGLRMRVVADRGMSPAGYRMLDVEVIAP